MALRWFCSRSLLKAEGLTKELIDRIPGKQTDRKTPLGELNWIFTAITDSIAWNMLPRSLFQRLFRQVSWTSLPPCSLCSAIVRDHCHRQHCLAHAHLLSVTMPVLAGNAESDISELYFRGDAEPLASFSSLLFLC